MFGYETIITRIIYLFLFIVVVRFLWKHVREHLNHKHQRIVEETSLRYAFMRDMHKTYRYEPVEDVTYWSDTLKSKKQLDDCDLHKKFEDKLSKRMPEVDALIRDVTKNKQVWKAYRKEMVHCAPFTTDDQVADINGISFKTYRSIEEQLCEDVVLTSPQSKPELSYTVTYTSPKGRNHYSRDFHATYRDITTIRTAILDAMEVQRLYLNSTQYQRKLLTGKLRYQILKRDGFRCLICGQTQEDGVKLHVDHIKPVSKGGKTVAYNLRTLCDACNLGKSDLYDPVGLN